MSDVEVVGVLGETLYDELAATVRERGCLRQVYVDPEPRRAWRTLARALPAPGADVAHLAEVHERALARMGVRPDVVMGFSLGGAVAFEMAVRRFERTRERMVVVVLDTLLWGGVVGLPLFRRLRDVYGERATSGVLSHPRSWATKTSLAATSLWNLLQGVDFDGARFDAHLSALHTLALKRYRPRTYDGPVFLARATECDERGLRDALGWAQCARDLRIRDVRADHCGVVAGAAPVVAEAIDVAASGFCHVSPRLDTR